MRRMGGDGVQGFCGGLLGASGINHLPGLCNGATAISVQGGAKVMLYLLRAFTALSIASFVCIQ
jgi:hypothetical protein